MNTFKSQFNLFKSKIILGDIESAQADWHKLRVMGRNWDRNLYRPGEAEFWYAEFQFKYYELDEADLLSAEKLAKKGRSRQTIRELHNLRGCWHLKRSEFGAAMDSFSEAIRMAREAGRDDLKAEAALALARLRSGDGKDVRQEAERLSRKSSTLEIIELWGELGERGKAVQAALATHQWAIADGEPYVHRYELERSRALLTGLGASLPPIPEYNPSKHKPFPWEADIRAAAKRMSVKYH